LLLQKSLLSIRIADDAEYANITDPVVRLFGLKTLLKTTADVELLPWKTRSKVMVRPERIFVLHVHLVYDGSLVEASDVNWNVDARDGVLHHYRSCDIGGKTTVTRMRYFQTHIIYRFRNLNLNERA